MQHGFKTTKRRFDTLYTALKDSQKQPFIGVTQGGSSRDTINRGARVAARVSDIQKKPRNANEDS